MQKHNKTLKSTSNSKDDSKSHTMGLRLDDEMYHQIIEFAHHLNLKKSQVIKQALHDWILFKMEVKEENLILVGKPFLRKLLEHIEEEDIKEIAEFSANNIGNQIKFKLMEHEKSICLEHFLEIFINTIGSPGFSWFNKISFKLSEDKMVLVFGNHSLNEKFSLYFKTLLESIMSEEFNYSIIKSKVRISENTVHLVFKPAT